MFKAGAPYPPEQSYPQHQGGYAQYPQGTVYPDAPPPGFQNSAPPPGFQASAPPPGFLTSVPPSAYPPNQSYPVGAYPGSTYPAQEFSYVGGHDQPPPYETHSTSNVNYEGLDDSMGKWEGFTDKAIRRSFIRKVYIILMLQLAFTTGIIALFIFVPKVKLYVQRNSYLYIISYVLFLVLYFTLVCCSEVRRKWPTNIILLSLFTMSLSYMVGTISSFHNTNVVFMAMGICAACCLAITLFSFNTKYDFTSCGGVLFVLCFVLFLFGIIAIFTYNEILRTIYAAGGALLFMLFLAYDTQMLMGGKKHQLSAEEHIFAALQLYLDVVYIFLFLLSLMGSRK